MAKSISLMKAAQVVVIAVADDPALKRAAEILDDLRQQDARLGARERELLQGDGSALQRDQVAALASGELRVDELPSLADIASQLQAVRSHRALLEPAINEAANMEATARAEARRRFLESDAVRAEYAAITDEAVAALVAMGRVQERSEAFGEMLRAAGAGPWPVTKLGPLGIGRIGQPTNQASLIGQWLIGAIVTGAISAEAVPREWRRCWGLLRDLEYSDATHGAVARGKVSRSLVEASATDRRLPSHVRGKG